MYPKFTLHASGHNPRSSKRERFRQRVMHKYVYIPKNFGLTACTGCGRCIRSCPGGINIRKAVEDINARLAKTPAEKGSAI
jgi:succinate dehydrogenase/fumarate reductase-like Fe-S protein